MPREKLYATVQDFQIDIEELARFYTNTVAKIPPLLSDNGADFEGWAITSRDGSITDGVKMARGEKNISIKEATKPTSLYVGAIKAALEKLEHSGLQPYRVRIMRLNNKGNEMRFHQDCAEKESWRVHIPIVTNENCFFEWRLDNGQIERIHMPADGRAFLVRVDKVHRAVNLNKEMFQRVHMIMGLNQVPPEFIN